MVAAIPKQRIGDREIDPFNRLRQGAERAQYCRRGQDAVDLAAEAVGKLQKDVGNNFQHNGDCQPRRRGSTQTAAWATSLLEDAFFWVPDLIKTILSPVVKPAIFSRDRLSSNSSTLNRVISKYRSFPQRIGHTEYFLTAKARKIYDRKGGQH